MSKEERSYFGAESGCCVNSLGAKLRLMNTSKQLRFCMAPHGFYECEICHDRQGLTYPFYEKERKGSILVQQLILHTMNNVTHATLAFLFCRMDNTNANIDDNTYETKMATTPPPSPPPPISGGSRCFFTLGGARACASSWVHVRRSKWLYLYNYKKPLAQQEDLNPVLG